ncbi:MAG: hypothetical protein ABIH41_04940 [Nanoarchaeota archaeon]
MRVRTALLVLAMLFVGCGNQPRLFVDTDPVSRCKTAVGFWCADADSCGSLVFADDSSLVAVQDGWIIAIQNHDEFQDIACFKAAADHVVCLYWSCAKRSTINLVADMVREPWPYDQRTEALRQIIDHTDAAGTVHRLSQGMHAAEPEVLLSRMFASATRMLSVNGDPKRREE